MRHLFVIIITLLMLQPIYVKADNSQLYKQLDAASKHRFTICSEQMEI